MVGSEQETNILIRGMTRQRKECMCGTRGEKTSEDETMGQMWGNPVVVVGEDDLSSHTRLRATFCPLTLPPRVKPDDFLMTASLVI